MKKNENEKKCTELLKMEAENLLQNTEMYEIKGGISANELPQEEGNCHGNGCNATCKKKQ